jgi:hypothetical protein
MPIDNCTHTFEELSATVLPAHYARLDAAMGTPLPADTFVGFKSVTKEALARVRRTTDLSGCYVFINGTSPYTLAFRGV